MEALQEAVLNGVISVLVVLLGILFSGLKDFILEKTKEFQAKTTKENYVTAQKLAMTAVQAVEQMFKDLHGAEKFGKGIDLFTELLRAKGVKVTNRQAEILIEAAVKEMNDLNTSVLDAITKPVDTQPLGANNIEVNAVG